MTQASTSAQLESTLGELHAEQQRDEQDLEKLEREARPIRARIDARASAIEALERLRSTLAEPVEVEVFDPEATFFEAREVELRARARRSDTTQQVWEIVRAAGRPISRQEIQREFEQRGWVNSKWANKFNVINNAINRAKDRFGFDELSRGLYEYREPEPAPTAVSDGEASHR